MTQTPEITRERIRDFILWRQHLLPPRTRLDVGVVLRDLGCIQIDPVNVVERNHHLVLWNRVEGYQTQDLEHLAYRDREVFEYRCNGASFLPVEDYPFLRPWMDRRGQRGVVDGSQVKEPFEDLIDKTYRRIDREGPLSSRQFTSSERVSWGYNVKTKTVKLALEFLFYSGRIGVHHREGNIKFYDLSEHVIPEKFLTESVSPEESMRYLALKALKVLGIATFCQWRDRLAALGNQWSGLDIPKLHPKTKAGTYLKSILDDIPVQRVSTKDSDETYFVPADDVESLVNLDLENVDVKAAFLPPLDNLLWDRERIEELFGFSYRWEIYMKAEKRRYGYYAMPILLDDALIGRLDPKLDRDDGILKVNLLQLEKGVDLHHVKAQIVDCLREFVGFHGADRVVIEETEPMGFADSLQREV